MKSLRLLVFVTVTLLVVTIGSAQTLGHCADQGVWSPQPIIFTPGGNIDIPILLTDGRVMVQYTGGGGSGNPYQDWWALTPGANGDYASGSWAALDSFNGLWGPEWAPDAFASAVLANGDVVVQGGEFNYSNGTLFLTESTDGAVYGRTSKRWSRLAPPTQWPYIGDTPSVVLANKTYMVGACGSGPCQDDQPSNYLARQDGLLSIDYSSWTVLMNNGKLTRNAEEGWTLLPGGQVLTVAVSGALFTCNGQPNTPYISEIFTPPPSGTWSCAGSTIQQLYGDVPAKGEVGPALLLPPTTTNPSGSVLATGASPNQNNLCSTGPQYQAHSAIYDVASHTWSTGPTFPCYVSGTINEPIGMGDRSAVLLPDGNAFLAARDLHGNSDFYEYTAAGTGGNSLCQITGAPGGLNSPQAGVRALLLPTGQVFITYNNANSYSYIYTPSQMYQPQTAWKPIITSFPSPIFSSTTYTIYGYQFNGMSQANMVGDEFQNATNYPLVRITDSQNHVVYAQTHDHSTMGVATGVGSINNRVSTQFDVPATGLASGVGSLVVVANGISSAPAQVCINQSQC